MIFTKNQQIYSNSGSVGLSSSANGISNVGDLNSDGIADYAISLNNKYETSI